ncbi:MAG: hypothetical protein E4H36_09170 [Spirochaetales bacterium]|nr:MAG: hypothetical protein E4H36_09170 [Spirochaetales bacterium]
MTGFFGQFECENNRETAALLLSAAETWLKGKGMTHIRGPRNFPINEATPGLLTEGFSSRPNIVLKTWNQRSLDVRKSEMLEIYIEAWSGNYGFIPFSETEFYKIVDDMMLVMDKNLFVFAYMNGELAAMFGGIPNISEKIKPSRLFRRFELLRAVKMILTAKKVTGFRLGYFAVRKKYRNLGIEALLLWKQQLYTQNKGYDYCDMGWILETNEPTIRLVRMMKNVRPSKTCTVFEKPL